MPSWDRGCGFEVRVLSGDEAAAALLRSLGFEKVTVGFEQPPAT
jgi:hypothetical protein